MNAPFTIEQFLGVFVAYNAAIWPAQIVAYGLGLVAVAALWLKPPIASQVILSILALMWAWVAIGYHFLFFSSINPAAKLFAAFFLLQALILAASAVAARNMLFQTGWNFRSIAGVAFIIYAMLIYPILGIWAGHGLMAGPMFGVAPCPTTIFTIGMLLIARGRGVVWLSVIPILWSLIGLGAALQLGIPEDLGMPVGGIVLLIILSLDLAQARLGGGRSALVRGSEKV